MMVIYAAAVFLLALLSGSEAKATQQLRDAPSQDEVCDKFYNLTSEFLEELRALDMRIYMSVVGFAQMATRVDITNPQALKQLVCKLTSLENLRDLQEMLPEARNRPDRYDRLVRAYKHMQELFGKIGGYTNIPRILKLAKDVRVFVMELPPEKSGPSEVVDLDKLTDFFEVMQVKYGSRWLSAIAMSENQMVLIEDPAKMAKELHDCGTPEEIEELLDIRLGKAKFIYKYLLRNRSRHVDRKKEVHIVEVAARIVYGLGEIGLYTLAY